MSIAALFYIAFLVLAYGLISKILQYKNTPAPLKIPTMPAPTTQAGVIFRMSKEVVFLKVFSNQVRQLGCLDGYFTLDYS